MFVLLMIINTCNFLYILANLISIIIILNFMLLVLEPRQFDYTPSLLFTG